MVTSVYWCSLSAGRVVFGIAAHGLPAPVILRVGLMMAPLAAWLLASAEHELLTFVGFGWLGFASRRCFPA